MSKNLSFGAKKYLLIFGDVLVLYFSLWLTLVIRYQSEYGLDTWDKHFWPFTFIFLLWLIIFYINNLYEINYTQGKANFLSRLITAMVIGGAMAVIFFYLAQGRLLTIRPQTVLLIDVFIAGLLLYLWHLLFLTFTKSSRIANGLMVVGYNPLVKEIAQELSDRP